MINWNISAEDEEAVEKIVKRVKTLGLLGGIRGDSLDLTMDIEACHLNGTPLDLSKLLAFPDFDFTHDIAGISRHLNRRTGKLGGHFLPRSAMRSGR